VYREKGGDGAKRKTNKKNPHRDGAFLLEKREKDSRGKEKSNWRPREFTRAQLQKARRRGERGK